MATTQLVPAGVKWEKAHHLGLPLPTTSSTPSEDPNNGTSLLLLTRVSPAKFPNQSGPITPHTHFGGKLRSTFLPSPTRGLASRPLPLDWNQTQTFTNIPQTFTGPPPSLILELRTQKPPHLEGTLCAFPLKDHLCFRLPLWGRTRDPFPDEDGAAISDLSSRFRSRLRGTSGRRGHWGMPRSLDDRPHPAPPPI